MIAIVIAVDFFINAILAEVIIIIIATVIIIFPQLAIVIAVIIHIATAIADISICMLIL